MHTEYRILDNGTVEVIEDNGNITKRELDSFDVDYQLKLENNKEYIDNVVRNITKYLESDHEFNKHKYFDNFEIPLVATFTGAAVGSLYGNDKLLIGEALLGGACCAFSFAYTGICNYRHIKFEKEKKEALKPVLEEALKMRTHAEAKIQELKNYPMYDESTFTDFMPVVEDYRYINNTSEKLNEVYKENVKTKKLRRENTRRLFEGE